LFSVGIKEAKSG